MEDINNLPQTDTDQDTSPTKGDYIDKEDTKSDVSTEKKDDFSPFEEGNDKEDKDSAPTSNVDIDDEDRKVMQAVAKDEDKVIINEVQGLKVDMKVNTFLADEKNKVYRDYQEKIRTYAKSPAAKGLTAEAIARLAVDPREMIARGAEEERKASKESRDSVSPGSTARTPEGSNKIPNAWDMPQDKFKETIEKIKRNR